MKAIHNLISYALNEHLIEDMDIDYVNNQLSWLLQVDPTPFNQEAVSDDFEILISPLLDRAFEIGLILENTITERDLIEAKIMDLCTPRPSDYQRIFDALYQISPKHATDDFYHRSIKSNYIKMARIQKNIAFKADSDYGIFDITINLSKPEKDPRVIAKALKEKSSGYPSCLLCRENVGYYGTLSHPARSNHRVVYMNLNNEPFCFQYSPYVYYNEHTILLHKEHIPMDVGVHTFYRLFDFVDRFPHYFMGSNAGLPIVGGSILNHEHYQGGRAHFPIHDAKVLKSYEKDLVTYELLKWPLSVVRLSSKDRTQMIRHAEHIRTSWLVYRNPNLGIFSHTEKEPHNAITPILRKQDGTYILDIAFRNNLTSDQYPMGIYHPHPEHHHIKKENIGLIEVMGLAILPGRLHQDLSYIKEIIKGKRRSFDDIAIYQPWIDTLIKNYKKDMDLDLFINTMVAKEFIEGLEDCGVFKQNQTGIDAFDQFIKETISCLKS